MPRIAGTKSGPLGALSAAFLAAIAGCAASPVDVAPSYQAPLACPAPDATKTASSSGPLPRDFVATQAWRCTYGMVVFTGTPSAGDPDVPLANQQNGWLWTTLDRAEGPIVDLAAALRSPPEPRDNDADLVCPAIAYGPTTLVLADAGGHTIAPALPTAVCGDLIPELSKAIAALHWTTAQRR